MLKEADRVMLVSAGLSNCAHELVAVRNQLSELGMMCGKASVLHGDNTASIMAA